MNITLGVFLSAACLILSLFTQAQKKTLDFGRDPTVPASPGVLWLGPGLHHPPPAGAVAAGSKLSLNVFLLPMSSVLGVRGVVGIKVLPPCRAGERDAAEGRVLLLRPCIPSQRLVFL